MYLNTPEEKQFELAEEGQYPCVLIDVVDLGNVATQFGERHKVMLVWQSTEVDSNGNAFRFFKRLNASLHPKSALYEAIKKITGVAPTKGFELDELIGTNSNLIIEHQTNRNTGKTYAIVSTILRLKTRNIPIPAGFVRKQDQAKNAKAVTAKPARQKPAVPADPLPPFDINNETAPEMVEGGDPEGVAF